MFNEFDLDFRALSVAVAPMRARLAQHYADTAHVPTPAKSHTFGLVLLAVEMALVFALAAASVRETLERERRADWYAAQRPRRQ